MKKYFIIFSLIILAVLVILVFKYNVLSVGKKITLEINQKGNYNDELDIELKDINDSRCDGSGPICIWEGEIGITLDVNDVEYKLGSVRTKTVDIQGTKYKIDYLPEYNDKTVNLKIYRK